MRWNLRTRSMLSLLFAGLIAAAVTGCKKKYVAESYQPAPRRVSGADQLIGRLSYSTTIDCATIQRVVTRLSFKRALGGQRPLG